MMLVWSLLAMTGAILAADDPLILTPYIEQGRIDEARGLAEVEPMVAGVKSYSGIIQVEHCNTKIFFWFFPADNDWTTQPLVFEMHGGPALVGSFGALKLNGPIQLNEDGSLQRRVYSWTRFASMVYIDYYPFNGYSEGDSLECLDWTSEEVDVVLLPFTLQFLQLFPELRSSPLLIYGEIYASKFATYLAYAIHQHNQQNADKINLEGILLGNGVVAPWDSIDIAPQLLTVGLIDHAGSAIIDAEVAVCRSFIEAENWAESGASWNRIVHSIAGTAYINLTKMNNFLDYRKPVFDIYQFDHLNSFLTSDKTRKALHVGQAEFYPARAYIQDYMKPTNARLQTLLDNKYRVLLWHGHYHLIFSWSTIEKSLMKLEGATADAYRTTVQRSWYVENELAGYVRSSDNLHHLFVREAAMAVFEQPKWCFDMVSKFLNHEDFNSAPTPVNEWANTCSVNCNN